MSDACRLSDRGHLHRVKRHAERNDSGEIDLDVIRGCCPLIVTVGATLGAIVTKEAFESEAT